MSDQSFGTIVPPAVENYRVLKVCRSADLMTATVRPSNRRTLIGLTSSALLIAIGLVAGIVASAHAEERPFLWPPGDEIMEMEGLWAPVGGEALEETTEAQTYSDAVSDNEEVDR